MMVTRWGLSDALGTVAYGENQEEVFLGYSVARQQNISEETVKKIDAETGAFLERAKREEEQRRKEEAAAAAAAGASVFTSGSARAPRRGAVACPALSAATPGTGAAAARCSTSAR